MIPIVLASVLIASALGCGTPPIQPLTTRVVNGVDAKPHSWPWQISLQYEKDGEWRHTCGGSLIAANWVMTAAHCINTKFNYRAFVGKYNLVEEEAGSKAIVPEKIVVHEKWNPIFVAFGNDIALIKLSESVLLTDHVQLGCIPPAETVLSNLYPCYITGWGRLYTGGPIADKLQQALMPVADYATCSKPDWWGIAVRTTMVCAGGDGIVAGCNGDSGGPLNCKNADGAWEVHGIASFVSGLGCNYVKKPTVFTRVSAFNSWIDQQHLRSVALRPSAVTGNRPGHFISGARCSQPYCQNVESLVTYFETTTKKKFPPHRQFGEVAGDRAFVLNILRKRCFAAEARREDYGRGQRTPGRRVRQNLWSRSDRRGSRSETCP